MKVFRFIISNSHNPARPFMLVAIVLTALVWERPLAAQVYEVGIGGGINRISAAALGSLNSDPIGTDSRLKGQYGIGLRLTLNTRGYYGHELGYLLNKAVFQTTLRDPDTEAETFREESVKIHQLSYNFLAYFMPRDERWRPFVTGGAQVQEYKRPNIDSFPSGSTRKYGVNFGGGIKLRLAKSALVRLDVREYITGKPYALQFEQPTTTGGGFAGDGFLRQTEASVGLSFTF